MGKREGRREKKQLRSAKHKEGKKPDRTAKHVEGGKKHNKTQARRESTKHITARREPHTEKKEIKLQQEKSSQANLALLDHSTQVKGDKIAFDFCLFLLLLAFLQGARCVRACV